MRGTVPARARWINALAAVIALAAIALWLVRGQIETGFGQVLGDVHDSTIEAAILEHWFNVLRGRASWCDTNYFYPHPGTLGYNDGYFLYGLIYALPRLLGADPYLATHIVNLVARLACLPFFLLFARGVLRMPFAYSLAGAAIVTLGNSLTIHALHAQLFTVALVPLSGWLLYRAGTALIERQAGRLFACGAAFAVIYGAWAMTAFYMLWFFTLFCACLAAWAALRHNAALLGLWRTIDRRCLWALAAVFALWLVCLVPFLLVYLPKASETGMHGFASARQYVPTLPDIVNIGVGNHLYRDVVMFLHRHTGFPWEFTERQMGLTPGVVLLFLVASIRLWQRRSPGATGWTGPHVLAQDIAVVTFVTYLLSLSIDGHSLWRYVFELVPGARAVRVVARYYIFLAVPIVCVGMFWLGGLESRRARIAAALVCVFLVGEQLNWAKGMSIDRAPAAARLEAARPAPGACRAFFVVDGRPAAPGSAGDELYRHNVEAMLLAGYLDLPTINGFSSFNPPGWDFGRPGQPDYLDRVRAFRQSHRIDGLCALDLQTMQWNADPL